MSDDQTSNQITINELLPDNQRKITKIKDELYLLNSKIRREELNSDLSEQKKEIYKNNLFHLLYLVGDLSIPTSEAKEKIQGLYILKYRKTPELGKKLFLDHYYDNICKPYDNLKKEIWKTINSLLPDNDKI